MTTVSAKPQDMNEVLGLYIKDVISAYPAVGDVLINAGIGCVTCSVGTCLLKDVVGIHNLTDSQEQALFTAIAGIIFPGQTVVIPKTTRKITPPTTLKKLAPPLQDLVDEHSNIKRVIAKLPAITADLKNGFTPGLSALVTEVLAFIRDYADHLHHAKEEKILFTYFDTDSDVLKIMCKEHDIGRSHVQAARVALENNDATELAHHLTAYGALLREHIRKEDEILYPWMNSELTDSQVGQLFSRFRDVDNASEAITRKSLDLVKRLESQTA